METLFERGVARRSRLLRVLVVDDDEGEAGGLAALLRLWGHDVQVAADGRAAVQAAWQDRPDAVLLDVGPHGPGVREVARLILGQYRGGSPLIVAMTDEGGEGDRSWRDEAGIDVRLAKPVDPDELEDLLERFRTATPN